MDEDMASGFSTCQILPLASIHHLKRQVVVKGREKRFVNSFVQPCVGSGTVSPSAHIWGTDLSFRLK
jgi:hypothetical protein